MDSERFRKIDAILEAVWQAEPKHRPGVLDRLCGQDAELRRAAERLIAADREDSFLMQPLAGHVLDQSTRAEEAETRASSESEHPALELRQPEGVRIGNYELVRCLGSGGMGSVFLARRHDDVHDEPVALKILDRAFENRSAQDRFRAERQILAHLSHPNIASLLDGGTTSGRPYLVMEWVDGEPLDVYCARHELPLEARLRVFQKICAAVHEAHRSLIVHRDLKPANILVDARGEPKLLDFGIAKLLRPGETLHKRVVTETGSRPMTPAYAAPEQVSGAQITTAVDVYALGILLYELLTGERPYEVSGVALPEAMRRICVEVPPRPSARFESSDAVSVPPGLPRDRRQLARRLRGDLDSMVGMALRKEPERRYASAESLRDDIQRHLEGRPVYAADDSLSYRLGKFLRRHRAAVSAAALLAILMVGFTLIILRQGRQVVVQRDKASFTSGFLLDLFNGVDPWAVEARNPRASELLERGRLALESGASRAPDARADLLHSIARAYAGTGHYVTAESLFREELTLRRELSSGDDPEIAATLVQLGRVMRWQGPAPDGLELAREGRQMFRRLGLGDSRRGLMATLQLADFLDQVGSYEEAEENYRAALAGAQHEPYLDLEAVAWARLGKSKRRLHLYEESLVVLGHSVQSHIAAYGARHPRTAGARTELGTVLLATGDLENAAAELARAESDFRELLGEAHPQLAVVFARQGQLALESGRLELAEELLNNAEASLRQSLGEHPLLAEVLALKASLLLYLDRAGEARQAAAESAHMFHGRFGARHVDTAAAEHRLAMAEAVTGRLPEAKERLREALRVVENLTGAGSPRVASLRADAGWLDMLARDLESAEGKLEQAAASLEAFHGDEHPELAKVYNNLAMVRHRRGAYEHAEADYRRAIQISGASLGEEAPLFGALHTNLARLLERLDRLAEASSALDRGAQIFDLAGLDQAHLWRLHGDRVRTKIWLKKGRYDDVEGLLRPWVELFEQGALPPGLDRRSTYRLLADALEAAGRHGEADKLRQEATAASSR